MTTCTQKGTVSIMNLDRIITQLYSSHQLYRAFNPLSALCLAVWVTGSLFWLSVSALMNMVEHLAAKEPFIQNRGNIALNIIHLMPKNVQ